MEEIREKQRVETRKHQSELRFKLLDRKRVEFSQYINDQEQLTEKDVIGLASRIKRRKRAEENDLKRLTAAFLHDPHNISEFCRITGALNVIMKEFTGSDSERKLLSAECLCNLALGEEACSKKVANAAGTYLLLFLSNTHVTEMVETCLWTLQNLLLSGPKVGTILIGQGLVPRLMTLINNTQRHSSVLLDAEGETLSIVVNNFWTQVPLDIQCQIPQLIADKFGISSNVHFHSLYTSLQGLKYNVDLTILDTVVATSILHLAAITEVNDDDLDMTRTILSIRMLTNTFASEPSRRITIFPTVISTLMQKKLKLSDIVQRLFATKNDTVIKETLWMAGTLYHIGIDGKDNDSDMFRYFTQVDPLEHNLQFPAHIPPLP